jgi:hypothetical protein
VPRISLDDYDRAEFSYWRARALENRNRRPRSAPTSTCCAPMCRRTFAYFARTRLDSAAMAAEAGARAGRARGAGANLIAAKKFDLAKDIQTDRILLSSRDREKQLRILTAIYRELPNYRAVLELEPKVLPHFPRRRRPRPDSLLMARGCTTRPCRDREALPSRSGTRSAHTLVRLAPRRSVEAIDLRHRSDDEAGAARLSPRPPAAGVRQLLYPATSTDTSR